MIKKMSVFLCLLCFSCTVYANQYKGLIEIFGVPFIIDLRYNTADNFLKKNVYARFGIDKCLVHPDVYADLQKAVPVLKEKHLKLVMWDCYRPPEVQKEMWKLVPDARYVADPKVGSNHNRGVAVDVTLADEKGNLLPMPTGFDDFSENAAPAYKCEPKDQIKCQNRDLLRDILQKTGLKQLKTEWWHFELPDAKSYPIIN